MLFLLRVIALVDKGRESAGLPNFVRLLENWQDKTLDIKGSLFSSNSACNYSTVRNKILADNSEKNDGG